MEFLILVISLIVVIGIHYYFCLLACDIAEEKGYSRRAWFHRCFWLGAIPFLLVVALPDKLARHNQLEIYKLLKKMNENE